MCTCECVAGGALGNSVRFFTATFICSSRERRRRDSARDQRDPEPSNFRTVTFQEYLEPLAWIKHTGTVRSWVFACTGDFIGRLLYILIVARKLNRLESQAGKPGKAEVSQVASGARSAGMSQKERPTFYRQEVNKTIWEVPVRYQNLSPVGSGAYGTVW